MIPRLLIFSVFPFSPMLGAALLTGFSALGLQRILTLIRAHRLMAVLVMSQFIFHALCLVVAAFNGLPFYIPLASSASNGIALLLAMADKRSLEQRGRTTALFLIFFILAVIWDFATRYHLSGITSFVTYFRYGMELSGRPVGPNVFAYSLVLTTVVVFSFTNYNMAFKRVVAAACLLGLVIIGARLPAAMMAIFLTFLCDDRPTRRYWIPVAIILGAVVFWTLPDLFSSGRLVTLLEGRDTSNSTRADIYSDFLSQFQSPIFGSGQGAYFQTRGFSFHNDFMEILYSSGAVGFILFYGGQAAAYMIIIGKLRILDRRVMSLFLLQFGFSLTESLSISLSSFTGIGFSYILYSFAVDRIKSRGMRREIDVSSRYWDNSKVSDLGPRTI